MKDATSLYRYVVKSQCRCQMSLCSVVALYAPLRDPGGSGGKVKKICLLQESNLDTLHSKEITLINIPIHS